MRKEKTFIGSVVFNSKTAKSIGKQTFDVITVGKKVTFADDIVINNVLYKKGSVVTEKFFELFVSNS